MHNNKTICLNMIVKNEAHIIASTLENLCHYIKFDYWVIVDTGSTDNTKQIVSNFFKDKNINGELHETEWKNFGYNRTDALTKAFNKTDYLLIFDADDRIIGNFILPNELNLDGYHLKFGNNFSYVRLLLVNNRLHWKFVGVLHEYIICTNENYSYTHGNIEGNYHLISGKSGARSNNPNKYRDDALILEKAYYEAQENKDDIMVRYSFYCAQSYKDAGNIEKAIEWYKKRIEHGGWNQEVYYSYVTVGELYSKMNNIESAVYYWTLSYDVDPERCEGIYYIVKHCREKGKFQLGLQYYKWIEKNKTCNLITKLFVTKDIYTHLLDYEFTIIACYVNRHRDVIPSFHTLFKHANTITICFKENIVYNLQFYMKYIDGIHENVTFFYDYLAFVQRIYLETGGLKQHIVDVTENMKCKFRSFSIEYNGYEKLIAHLKKEARKQKGDDDEITKNIIKYEKYKHSKKILFYTGYSLPDYRWNKTMSLTNSMGGSEKAIIYLTEKFPKDYDIYICGDVVKEECGNIHFVNFDKLKNILDENEFHTVIMSRYIELIVNYKIKCYKLYIWAHDTCIRSLSEKNNDANEIIKCCIDKIDGCICLTHWHKEYFSKQYDILTNKIIVINNGIELVNFPKSQTKIKNTFVYTSRSERGLQRVLELWESISENIKGAHLSISSYNAFPDPKNNSDTIIECEIKKYSNVVHLGKLNEKELYDLMNISEYWLYPTNFHETSCITAMEMLKSRVICLYYSIGGLVDTINGNGIQLIRGEEVNQISKLTEDEKQCIIENGERYAHTCSWENRYKEWENELFRVECKSERKFNILNLILFSNENCEDREYYLKMIQLQKKYMKSYSGHNITFYFYCYKEDLREEYVIEDDVIYIKGTETYIPGILEKTMKAFEVTKNIEYDFLLRSNISTVIDYSKLNEILYKIPHDVIYAGGSCLLHNWIDDKCGIHKIYNIPFILGTSIILRREGVCKLIENKNLLSEKIIDDFAIGLFFNHFGDKPYGFDKYYRYNLSCISNDVIFYRNRQSYEKDYKRDNDIINMQNIIKQIMERESNNNIDEKIKNLHSKLIINHGTFNDELPEQKMVVRYLSGNEKVLEIGGNIGRNSLIIASILKDNTNFVTLECDAISATHLQENRDLNHFNFHIENSALSNRMLIQKGWDTIPSDTLLEGYTRVNTIQLNELIHKYNINFDTLVLDCEGAFYYILMDMPHILDNIKLIIMENDYHDISKKNYVNEVLTKNNFYVDYQESGGWGACFNCFFEVWKKNYKKI
jgi:hypothetical protein